MNKPLTLEENTELAETVLTPIIELIDMAVEEYDIDRLKATYEKMQDQTNTLRAFPFPDTIDKSDSHTVINKMFKAVMDMIEIRIEQRELAIKQANGKTDMQNLMNILGA